MFEKIKIGFIPSYRFHFSEWDLKLYNESLSVLKKIKNIEVVTPKFISKAGYKHSEPFKKHGAINHLDEAEVAAEYFRSQKVDALIIAALDFGDERSSSKIAEMLDVPVLLFATKEPPALNDQGLSRVSDSYCGTLSIASALYRRKLKFHFAG
ncbi:unnamed protein product, partial [marine sediment metagenome]